MNYVFKNWVLAGVLIAFGGDIFPKEPVAGGSKVEGAQKKKISGRDPANREQASAPSEFNPPSYQVMRQNEDWSGLASGSGRDPFDSVKYVPLNNSGSVWASFGGQARLRVEAWDGFNFGAPTGADDSDVWAPYRFYYYSDLHLRENVRFFVQGKSALATDRGLVGGRRPIDVDEFDLLDGFVEVSFPVSGDQKLTFRAGRQGLLLGKQRLVSPLDWVNTRRTFTGFTSIWQSPSWKATGFWTRPVKVRKFAFNRPDPNVQFFGLYVTGSIPRTKIGLNVYWLGLDKKRSVFNGTSGREQRQTLGGRIWGEIAGTALDFEIESAYQFGSLGSGDISAGFFSGEIGYKFPRVRMTPRIHLGFDYASGDSETGGDVGTFNQLFPLAHAFLGYIDTVARQNIVDLAGGLSFRPAKKVTTTLALHNFWRADSSDALYSAGGGVVRSGTSATPKRVGMELNLVLKYQIDRHMSAVVSYNHFSPGQFIEQSGPSESTDFGFLILQYTF